jgi:pimeloyl-ACP methyl ester carboxylesterase
MEAKREVRLSAGTVRVADTGSVPGGPTIVFLHGLVVDGGLWRDVVARVSEWARCVVPDLPLGSHRVPMNADADLAPPAVADLVAELLETMDLRDVTLVGNDTGGAIAQLVVTRRPERVARLVLTPCDAFDVFPPKQFKQLTMLPHIPGALWAFVQPTRLKRLHNSPLVYGLLTRRPIPQDLTTAWLEPARTSKGVRRDAAKVLRGVSPQLTLDAAERLRGFDKPALVVWGADDRLFRRELGERLAAVLPQGRLEVVEDTGTFLPLDQPGRLAELLEGFVREPALSR